MGLLQRAPPVLPEPPTITKQRGEFFEITTPRCSSPFEGSTSPARSSSSAAARANSPQPAEEPCHRSHLTANRRHSEAKTSPAASATALASPAARAGASRLGLEPLSASPPPPPGPGAWDRAGPGAEGPGPGAEGRCERGALPQPRSRPSPALGLRRSCTLTAPRFTYK